MTWLIILLSLYVIYCGLLFFFQTKLIFPAGMAGEPGRWIPTPDTEVIELPTDEGTTRAWFIPGPTPGSDLEDDAEVDKPKPLVVFFHGNAELIDQQGSIIAIYRQLEFHVLMVEYRGYGQSDGTPSEAHIVADSLAVLEEMLDREDVDPDKLVLHGRSIGGGMAAQVALQTDPAALIVESTFTSVSSMAPRYGAPPFIVTSPLKSEQAFTQLSVPILIMHGKSDSIVPISHAHKLEKAATDATLVLFDAGHNDLPNGPEVSVYRRKIEDLLKQAGVLPE